MALDFKNYEPALMQGAVQALGATAFTGAITMSSTLAVSGVTSLTGNVLASHVVTASGGTTRTLLAANTGSINQFDSAAGITYTLPVPAVGLYYDFITTTLQTSSAHVVVTDAGTTFLVGTVYAFSGEKVTPSSTLGPYQLAANGTSHIKYTSNGTTTGGGIGTSLRFTCISASLWFVSGFVNSPSGTIATPFST